MAIIRLKIHVGSVFHRNQSSRSDEVAYQSGECRHKRICIGRIQQDQVEPLLLRPQVGSYILTAHLDLFVDTERLRIRRDNPAGTAVLVYEQTTLGTARDGFEPKRPATGVQIDDRYSLKIETSLDHREQRFAHPVGYRPGAFAFRCEYPPAAKPASDDLLTTDAIEDAIEAFAEDLAAFWGLSQDSA